MMNALDMLAGASRSDIARVVSELAVKASLILAVALALSSILRRASAATRHLIWTSALVMVLALPLCAMVLPSWHVPLFERAPSATPAPVASSLADTPIENKAMRRDLAPAPHPHDAARVQRPTDLSASDSFHGGALAPSVPARGSLAAFLRSVDWIAIALAVWVAGAVITILRLTLGVIGLRVIQSRTLVMLSREWMDLTGALSRQIGLTRPVRLLQSQRATMPLSWGWVRPVVLLPADASSWSMERRRIVLLHELAHVKRRDCLTQMLAQIVCAAYWFNPLTWLAASRLRAERERACDDLVLSAGTPGTDYADHLLDIARAFRSGGFPSISSWATVAMAKPSQLEGRLLAILDPTRRRRMWPRWACAMAVTGIGALALPIATLQPWMPAASAEALASDQTPSPTTDSKPVGGVPGGVASGVPGGVANGARGGVPGGVKGGQDGGVVAGVTGGVASGVAAGVEAGVSAGVAAALDSMPVIADVDDDRDVDQTPDPAKDRRVVDALVTALKDDSKEVRQQAAEALGHISDPRAIDGLTIALRDASPDVREQAASALSRFKSSAATGALLLALKDQSPEVRRQAIGGIVRMRDADHVNALTMAMQDSDAEVRQQAAHGLGQVRAASAIEPLTRALKDSNAEVRQQAAHALSQIRDPRTVPALISAIGDADADVRQQVVFALGQLRAVSSIDALIGALKDTDPDVRQQAAFGLGQIRDAKAVDALAAATTDAHADVRQQSVFALGQIRNAAAVPALIAALSDKAKDVRQQAAFALGQLRDPRAVDPLTAALRDPSPDVREQAAHALGQLVRDGKRH